MSVQEPPPRFNDQLKKARIDVRVTPETLEALDQAAEDDDRSRAEMHRKILRDWLRMNGYL